MKTSTGGPNPGVSRRERLRLQLVRDARSIARDITAASGLEGLTVAAVARELAVSPPALYRHFDGKDGLVRAVYEDLTADLITAVEDAVRRQDADDMAAKLHAATRAVLTWSRAHRGAFELLMGSAYPVAAKSEGEIPQTMSRELGGVFADLFTVLWHQGTLTYPADDEFPPVLRKQLETYRNAFRPDLPLGVAHLMLTCWRQIYGVVSMTVNGHLAFAFDDYDALFEDMMASLLGLLGVEPSPNVR